MQRTGPLVTLKIAKQAAIYHNLSEVINSVANQTIVSPQAVLPPTFVPPVPLEPAQQFPIPDRKHLLRQQQQQQPAQMNSIHPIERHHPPPPPPPEIQLPMRDMRTVQLQTVSDRQVHHFPQQQQQQHEQQDRLNTLEETAQQHMIPIPERQVHFQPTPPTMLFEDHPSLNLTNPTSPLKSPKKVSWVDTQPHQSLHTLIPPSPAAPSPTVQQSSTPEIPSPPSQLNDNYHEESQNFIPIHYNNNNTNNNNNNNINNNHQYDLREMTNGRNRMQEGEESNHDDGRLLKLSSNGQHVAYDIVSSKSANESDTMTHQAASNGQLDTTAESLTLEDIDQVLSSKTHNNWLEDSAGVIGTQEVYNDPRQRIVKERERPNDEVNIEKLSFQEKLKMFSAKK